MVGVIRLVVAGAAVIAVGAMGSEAAQARIVCNGAFQMNPSGPISTPYCEDEFLAQVARGYGMRVSGRAVRQNPNLKERVCRFVGHDIRVSSICSGLRPEDQGGRFPG